MCVLSSFEGFWAARQLFPEAGRVRALFRLCKGSGICEFL